MSVQGEIHNIEIRYEFSEDEINAIVRATAKLNQDLQHKEAEKKVEVAHFNHIISQIKEAINTNFDKVNNGYEERQIQARLHKNFNTYQREWYALDSDSLVKSEDFLPRDYQRNLDDELSEAEAETSDKSVYERLAYNEVDKIFSREDCENELAIDVDWKIIAESTYPAILDAFLESNPERGTFDEVKEVYINFVTNYLKNKAENEKDDNSDNSDDSNLDDESSDDEPTDPDAPIGGASPEAKPDIDGSESEIAPKAESPQSLADKMQAMCDNFGASELTVTGTDASGNETSITVKGSQSNAEKPKRTRKKYVLQSKRNKAETA